MHRASLTGHQQKAEDQITSLGAIQLFFQIKAMWTESVYRSVHFVHSAGSGEASKAQAQEEERSSN